MEGLMRSLWMLGLVVIVMACPGSSDTELQQVVEEQEIISSVLGKYTFELPSGNLVIDITSILEREDEKDLIGYTILEHPGFMSVQEGMTVDVEQDINHNILVESTVIDDLVLELSYRADKYDGDAIEASSSKGRRAYFSLTTEKESTAYYEEWYTWGNGLQSLSDYDFKGDVKLLRE